MDQHFADLQESKNYYNRNFIKYFRRLVKVIFSGRRNKPHCISFIFSPKTFFMKPIYVAAKISFLVLIAFFLQSYSGPTGGDYYKVLLNNRLITEQYLAKPVAMKTLSLAASNNNDHLIVYYSHCGTIGKERTVFLRSHSGTVLKEWKFADSKSFELQLPVKDVLNASAKKGSVFLYYASKEIPSGKQLLSIDLSNRTIAKL